MLKAKWESLNEREQRLVGIGGTALLVAIFYWGLWQPLGDSMARSQKLLQKQQATNNWAKEAVVKLKSSSGTSQNGASLSQIINSTARRFNVQIGRMNPKGDQLNLLVEEIVFNDLLKWIAHLEQSQGVKIINLDVSELEQPGKVRVSRLLLEKS